MSTAPAPDCSGRDTRRRLRPGARPSFTAPREEAVPDSEPATSSQVTPIGSAKPRTMMLCLAPHPAQHKAQYADRPHLRELGPAPFWLQPTGRLLDSYDQVDTDNGCMGHRCPSSDCKRITEYRVVAHPGCTGEASCATCAELAAATVITVTHVEEAA